MTDTNIIHALQCCGVETNCRNCPLYEERSADCIYTVLKNALDLIIRQQTELENLKVELQSMRGAANSLKMHYEEAQAEIERLQKNIDGLNIFTTNHMKVIRVQAIKEFAKYIIDKSQNGIIQVSDIPDYVKEMTEVQE